MTEDDGLPVFEVVQRAAPFWLYSECLEKVGGDDFTLDMLRFRSANQIEAFVLARGKGLQNGACCVPPVDEIGIRRIAVECSGLAIVRVHLHQKFGIWKWQCPKKHSIEDAEHS